MKKLISLLAVVTIIFAFSSCKKDYTCTCTITASNYVVLTDNYTDIKKADAETKCSANESVYLSGVVCEIK